jgi:Ca-activated chloride channel homolog
LADIDNVMNISEKPYLRSIVILISGALLCGGLVLAPSWSQQPPQKPPENPPSPDQGFKIGVEVNMVTVPVTVRQRDGGFVKSVPQNAFHIYEDGEEQEILTFAQEGVPARIAIVLDVSGSVNPEWGTIKYATQKFAENLQSDDRFAIVTFNTEIRLKMDWGRAIDRISPVLGSIFCKDNTNLWDAVWTVSKDVFKGIRDKKAMIIMTDGLDNNSSISYDEALNAAVHSEAAVYVVSKTEAIKQSILYSSAQAGFYDSIPEKVFLQADLALRKLAYETGGRVLYPNNFGQLDNIYAQVDEELRNQYSIGYISSNQIKDGSYRKIEVRVASSAPVTVSARPGYYVPNEMPAGARRP